MLSKAFFQLPFGLAYIYLLTIIFYTQQAVHHIGACTAQCTVELYHCVVEWGFKAVSTLDKRAGFTSRFVAGFHSLKLSLGFLLWGGGYPSFD